MSADFDLLKLANDLRLSCQIISRRVRFEGTRELAPHQMSVLGKLTGQALPVGTLASAERVSAPSMTRTVNCLVEDGLVAKVAHPADGRQVLVEITPKGREAIARAVSDRDCWMVSQLEEVDAAELRELARLVELLGKVASR